MEEYIIKVENLTKTYRIYNSPMDRMKEALSITHRKYSEDFFALNNISFEVKKGENIGLIGTNGAGKSTLLKIITGVLSPSEGNVEVKGKVSALLELGAGFNPEYSGIENIYLNGTMMGYTREEMQNKVPEIIKFADIGEFIEQPVKNYSSGMFARLAFAVAISVEPDILIVDEALAVGDVFFQSKCYRKFEELRDKGISILFVSHDISTIRKMCDRVLWIEHGVQQMFGESQIVCNQYFNKQVKRINEQNEDYLNQFSTNKIDLGHAKEIITVPRIYPSVDSVLSNRAEIVSVFVKDKDGKFTKVLRAYEKYTVSIVSVFHEKMENIIVGFNMSNRQGVTVIAENTFEKGNKAMNAYSGDIIVSSFKFTMPEVRSGEYEISPAIAQGTQGTHVNVTWLHGVISISMEREGTELAEIGVPMEIENMKLKDINYMD